MTEKRRRLPGPDLRGARTQAYALAMAPFLFQAARAARELGVCEALRAVAAKGLTATELAQQTAMPQTSIDTLLDALASGELVACDDEGRWRLTTVGLVWTTDPQVQVESTFTQEVCWQGLSDLPQSLAEAKPIGLRHLGPWASIYEGLTQLSPSVAKAWFDYDHGHSDSAFKAALEILADNPPAQLLDVGANTGRFALRALARLPATRMALVDLPKQLAEAETALNAAGFTDRVSLHAMDLLDQAQPFPGSHDAVWMSQFLDCFAPDDVIALFKRARAALGAGGVVYVLECCPDRQAEAAAAHCLRMESLYFVGIANGVSRFYPATVLIQYAEQAGLKLDQSWDNLGTAHSLFRFVAA